MALSFSFTEELWVYPGEGAWYFITLPLEFADEIKGISGPLKKGFGSIHVSANIGDLTWNTSIFPDSKSKSYVLPIKKEVREKNNLEAGVKTKVLISLLDIR